MCTGRLNARPNRRLQPMAAGSCAGRLVLAAIPAQIGQLLRVTQLDELCNASDTRAWGGSSDLARAE